MAMPLDIAWTHAYWAEGPEFAALGLADGAAVATWPDEAGTDDLAQATAANRPALFAPSGGWSVGTLRFGGLSNPEFNDKPVVRFDGINDRLSVDWSNLTQPNEVAVVARLRSVGNPGGYVFDGINSTQRHLFYFATTTNPDSFTYGASSQRGWTAADITDPHMWRFVFNGASSFAFQDEAQQDTGDSGSDVFGGLLLGSRWDVDTDWFLDVDVAFVGVKNGSLTTQERSDLHAWSQSTYSTP